MSAGMAGFWHSTMDTLVRDSMLISDIAKVVIIIEGQPPSLELVFLDKLGPNQNSNYPIGGPILYIQNSNLVGGSRNEKSG